MDDEARRRHWGASVRQRRLDQGMTQIELAEAVGIQQTSLSKIERGAILGTERTRFELARALKIEVSDLFPYPAITSEKAAS